MQGHKVQFNEAGDREVDKNFWVQAAAEKQQVEIVPKAMKNISFSIYLSKIS
jgi:hypothetical protein